MRLSFPHMGHLWVPIKTLCDRNGVDVVVPPKCSKRTLSLGTKYSPEWVCMPFKTNLGNYIEALELGADTLIGVSGPGLCRLGYYAKLEEAILTDLGYKFTMLNFNWQNEQAMGLVKFVRTIFPNASWLKIISDIKYGILSQLFFMDEVERRTHYLRPREKQQGSVTKIWRTVAERVANAQDPKALKQVKSEVTAELDAVELDPSVEPLRVGILGEYFMAMEPFCNQDIEEEMGRMRVEVTRAAYLSEWAKVWLVLEGLGLSHGKKVAKAAFPYLSRDVSGDAVQSLGETILHAQDGFDGIVHLQPFTCMPEIIAQNIFPRVSRDFDIPVLCLILDEQMGKAGLQTRLEAFVDLMYRRRQKRRAVAAAQAQPENASARFKTLAALDRLLSRGGDGHCASGHSEGSKSFVASGRR